MELSVERMVDVTFVKSNVVIPSPSGSHCTIVAGLGVSCAAYSIFISPVEMHPEALKLISTAYVPALDT